MVTISMGSRSAASIDAMSLIDSGRRSGIYEGWGFATGFSSTRNGFLYEFWPAGRLDRLRASKHAYRRQVKAEIAVLRAISTRLESARSATMNQPVPPKPSIRGPLVEDETVVGGLDDTGASVIKPKTPDGKADESVKPTDPREARR